MTKELILKEKYYSTDNICYAKSKIEILKLPNEALRIDIFKGEDYKSHIVLSTSSLNKLKRFLNND